jgi:two-component system response regulator
METSSEKTILLVEDNEYDLFLTKRALADLGVAHRLVIASDGAEALKCLFDQIGDSHLRDSGLPDLVILDLKLPKIDGLKVLEKIRSNEKTRPLPVLVMTSSDEETDISAARKLGATSYNIKPVDSGKFARMIRQEVTKYLAG